MPTCITYLNFNIVDLLVWGVLRVAEAENKETAENRGEFVFYREYRGGETGSTRRHLGHLPARPT